MKNGSGSSLFSLAKSFRVNSPMFRQHILIAIVLLLAMLVSFNCSNTSHITTSNYHVTKTPPGTIKIADNFYCDRTEICNIHWREYMYWTKRVFGVNSPEYNAILPDTMVWAIKFPCLKLYETNYLRQPEFDFNPVVGITQQQATAFSKWRADRVFEKLLIDLYIIEYDSLQTGSTYFTIEKYFTGAYQNIKPDKQIIYFPDYRLPTLSERNKILQYADTVDRMYFDTCTTKYCADNKKKLPLFRCGVMPCVNDSIKTNPTIDARKTYSANNKHSIFNLRGNVGEWAFESNMALGGSWLNSRQSILQSDTFNVENANCFTGFRNVCEWKRWKE